MRVLQTSACWLRCALAAIVLSLAPIAFGPSVEGAELGFADGDIVIRSRDSVKLYRDRKEIASWGESWHVCTDNRGSAWLGIEQGERVVLRRHTSPSQFHEHKSGVIGQGLKLVKILRWQDWLYLVYTAPHEEDVAGPWQGGPHPKGRIRGDWVHVLPFSMESESFGRPIPLRDFFGQSEIIVREKKLVDGRPIPKGVRKSVLLLILFDAAMASNGELWLSTQSRITSYRLAGLPTGLLKILDPAKIEGYGQRSKKIDWWISQHGNGTGIAALSATEVLVVNGNPPGWLTIVDTVRPENSRPLTRAVFPDDPALWGLRPVLVLDDEILVAHTHPKVARVYRVSRHTGQSLGTFAEGVAALEMVQIRK